MLNNSTSKADMLRTPAAVLIGVAILGVNSTIGASLTAAAGTSNLTTLELLNVLQCVATHNFEGVSIVCE